MTIRELLNEEEKLALKNTAEELLTDLFKVMVPARS